ncbi:MAG: hypothetical protein WBN79_14365, partial [Gemmatimonadota bacterium]
MRPRYLAILAAAAALGWACTPAGDTAAEATSDTETVTPAEAASPLMQRAQALFEVVPATPPELEDNPITPVKVELGK